MDCGIDFCREQVTIDHKLLSKDADNIKKVRMMNTRVRGLYTKKAYVPLCDDEDHDIVSISHNKLAVPTESKEYLAIVKQLGWSSNSNFVICWPELSFGDAELPQAEEDVTEY